MTRFLILLAASALLAGGCSSTQSARNTPPPSAQVAAPKPVPAQPAGTLQTAWGELPTYRAEGEGLPLPFAFARPKPRPQDVRFGDTAVVDVLVNRDGSIRDVKLQTSSGFEAVDRYVINSFVGAQALLQIAATDPAPYVIRQTFRAASDGPSSGLTGYSDYRADPPPAGTGQPYWGR